MQNYLLGTAIYMLFLIGSLALAGACGAEHPVTFLCVGAVAGRLSLYVENLVSKA